jgi:hypothetical protein
MTHVRAGEVRSVSPASAFRSIVSNTEDEWTVRFHTVRSGESWVSDDLEGYGSEGVMVPPNLRPDSCDGISDTMKNPERRTGEFFVGGRLSLLDTSLAGQEITRAMVVMLVAVGTLERADIRVGHKRVRTLAGNALTRMHGEPLTTGFAFDQPDQGHPQRPPGQNILAGTSGGSHLPEDGSGQVHNRGQGVRRGGECMGTLLSSAMMFSAWKP